MKSRHVTDLSDAIVLPRRKVHVRGEGKMSADDKSRKMASTSTAKIPALTIKGRAHCADMQEATASDEKHGASLSAVCMCVYVWCERL